MAISLRQFTLEKIRGGSFLPQFGIEKETRIDLPPFGVEPKTVEIVEPRPAGTVEIVDIEGRPAEKPFFPTEKPKSLLEKFQGTVQKVGKFLLPREEDIITREITFKDGRKVPIEISKFGELIGRDPETGEITSAIDFLGAATVSRISRKVTQKTLSKLSKVIAKSTNIDDIFRSIKNLFNIGDEAVQKVARNLVDVTEPKQVENVLSQIQDIGKVQQAITKPIQQKITTGINNISKRLDGITSPTLKLQASKQIAINAAALARNNPTSKIANDASKKLFKRVGEALSTGEITVNDLPPIMAKYNVSPQEFGALYTETMSLAGKQLNTLSKLAKEINAVLPGADVAVKDIKRWSFPWFMDKFRKAEQTRRGLLVTQMATAARNVISQTGRYSLQVFDDIFTGMGEVIVGKQSVKRAFAPAIEDVMSFTRRINKADRIKLQKILDEFPLESAKLLNRPVADVTMSSKAVKLLNTLNSSQEYFFRKMAFDAKINSGMIRAGITKPTQEMIEGAVEQALEVTFATTPKKGTMLGEMYRFFNNPVLTALGNPFPRFWANSIKFLWDFNPTGFTKLLNKEFRKELLSSNPQKALTALSKATLGTMMLGGAMAIRNSELGGERWYEIRLPDGETLDTRAFAPFSTYLFIAEAAKGKDAKLSATDWLQGAISINRIAGTGLVIVDLVRSNDKNFTIKKTKEILGAWTGGFTVPFRTIKDFLAQKIPEEATYINSREFPFIGNAIGNIPFVGQAFPQTPKITREEPLKREAPALRQITGITIKTKTFLETEIDRLQLTGLFPKTGNPKLDRIITEKVGRVMEKVGEVLEENEGYAKLPDFEKEKLIKEFFSESKSIFKKVAISEEKEELARDIVVELKKETDETRRRKIIDKLRNKGMLTDELLAEINKQLGE